MELKRQQACFIPRSRNKQTEPKIYLIIFRDFFTDKIMKYIFSIFLVLILFNKQLCGQQHFLTDSHTSKTFNISYGERHYSFFSDGTFKCNEYDGCTQSSTLGIGKYSLENRYFVLTYEKYPVDYNRKQKISIEKIETPLLTDSIDIVIQIKDSLFFKENPSDYFYASISFYQENYSSYNNVLIKPPFLLRYRIPKISKKTLIRYVPFFLGSYEFKISKIFDQSVQINIEQFNYYSGISYKEEGTTVVFYIQNKWSGNPRLWEIIHDWD